MDATYKMRLERNDELDCYIAYPCGVIATPADVQLFIDEYVRWFEPLGRKVDVIIVLDMFTVMPAVAELWSIARKAMVERFTNFTVRVSAGGNLAFFLKKNPAANSAYDDYAEDITSAIALLVQKRASQPRSKPHPRPKSRKRA